MTSAFSRSELIDKVDSARPQWHERSVKRIESSDSDEESRGNDFNLAFNLSASPKKDGKPPTISVRQRIERRDGPLESHFDVVVVFGMCDDFPAESDSAVREFVIEVAFEYVLGMIRSAYLDSAGVMGESVNIIPAVDARLVLDAANR